MNHFHRIARVPGDPILGLMEAYRADRNPAKFDLGVGVYKDAQGLTPIPHGGQAGGADAADRAKPLKATSAAMATRCLADC